MKTMIWDLTALFAASSTAMVWLPHRITAWVLGAMDAGAWQDADAWVGL